MKKTLSISVISIVGGALFALCLSQIAFSKAHVPARKGQICAQGNVLAVSSGAVRGFMERGTLGSACVLPACDFANVFNSVKGCDGLVDDDNDGLCDLPNERDSAEGITAACPVGTY